MFYHVIWGCTRKEFTFAGRGLWRKGLQDGRSRQSDLMAISDLEEQKHKYFLEKQYAGAHANIAQKPNGASSRGPFFKVA